ncbi:ParB/RepB/Spo0J family partition protein [Leptolyngbya sp. AN03gr2]|uniref:ParB/RepB/Spo0J family partition protein n=1 Tax=unclassified Leptolyngbya TaxID=2650499 RepID=UPI003D323570
MVKEKSRRVDEDFLGLFGSDTESQVEELQAEIQRLKQENSQHQLSEIDRQKYESLLADLRQQLSSKGVVRVSIKAIKRNPKQPRETFTSAMIAEMATSLEEEGQLDPIILLPGEILFDGECRWRAATEILFPTNPERWSELDAVYLGQELSEEELHGKVLAASIRNGLNPLDLAKALMQQCRYVVNLSDDEVVRALRNAVRRLERHGGLAQLKEIMGLPLSDRETRLKALDLDEAELRIFQVLMRFKQNPSSVNANVFPKLKLPEDLKKAIRLDGLEVFAADALQRVSAKNLGLESEDEVVKIRADATAHVIKHKLSKAETQQYVANLIANYSPTAMSEADRKVERFIQTIEQVSFNDFEESHLKKILATFNAKTRELKQYLKSEKT